MSATLPQMAFWVIFPLAAFVVVTGWSLSILVAVKRLRSPGSTTQVQAGNVSERSSSSAAHPRVDDPDVIETATHDGVHFSPLP